MPVLSRRAVFGLTSAAGLVSVLPSALMPRSVQAASSGDVAQAVELLDSSEHAFTFQNLMMDAYATGNTVRLTQSYSDAALCGESLPARVSGSRLLKGKSAEGVITLVTQVVASRARDLAFCKSFECSFPEPVACW